MNKAYEQMLKELIVEKNDYVVVAVSGGADSMSLLHMLAEAKEKLQINIVCAHVNHNMRIESESEKDFVKDFCTKYGILFEYMKIENYGDDNFHNEARTIRYNFFRQLVKKYSAKYLLTAHHGDDLIETVMMRIVRGSTLKGYSGFSKLVNKGDYFLLRPLIHVTKDDIYQYIKENELSYMQDNSNFKDVYTRNRFRKYIVPLLKKEDKNVHNKFYKFSTTILEYNDYINKQVNEIQKHVLKNKIIDVQEFSALDHVIGVKIINNVLENLYHDDLMLITDNHVELIYDLIISSKPNACIHLPNNMRGIKSYNVFKIEKITPNDSKYEIEINEYIELPNGKNIKVIGSSDEDSNNICRLNYSDIHLPLYVRNRKDGDRMTVKGMVEMKKIKEIFINSKIEQADRELWPIVVDSNENIVWIPGLKKSKFNRPKNEKCDIILRYY